MSALAGAMVLAAVLLGASVVDLLRSHGRALRQLHELDPLDEDAVGPSAPDQG